MEYRHQCHGLLGKLNTPGFKNDHFSFCSKACENLNPSQLAERCLGFSLILLISEPSCNWPAETFFSPHLWFYLQLNVKVSESCCLKREQLTNSFKFSIKDGSPQPLKYHEHKSYRGLLVMQVIAVPCRSRRVGHKCPNIILARS